MAPMLFAVLTALAATASTAVVERRDRTCTVEFYLRRTQNPLVGGDNTLTCAVYLDYGDSRNDILASQCNQIWHGSDHCYHSQLPYSICIHAYSETDGYMDYGSEHRDFNGDGCKQDKSASISGDSHTITCTFPCT
ncbi:uncharacterized protein ATNIH1004_009739 [Aspergillus tanneri]|uniref:Cyanovirin-N domain-containing protein n=1 Tax=Aspergillus tanneri TaxID=1220188 RepID=A0A5M9MJI7_9EURO|nr:uncharacterized protein ATNIH1004_009739 [Aspergillus tanneri]KAA8642977.1 hypothetical protein ATNIH1004_009739 [Aspergillus tanneri]